MFRKQRHSSNKNHKKGQKKLPSPCIGSGSQLHRCKCRGNTAACKGNTTPDLHWAQRSAPALLSPAQYVRETRKKKLGSSSPSKVTTGGQDTEQHGPHRAKHNVEMAELGVPTTAFSPDACPALYPNYQLLYVIDSKHGTPNISDPVQSSSPSVNVQHETTPFN